MTRVILGDIAISQTGPFGSQLHEEDYVSEGTPIVTVEHLGDTNFTHQNLPFVSEADTKRLSKYILIEGDIVFSRVGSIDRNVYVDKNHEGWMFSGRCIRVRADKNKVNPRYLSYYFKQNSFKKMMMNLAVGATMPSLNTKIMNSIELDLLPRENQVKIANILSAIDDKIQINNQINQELEAMAKTLYDYWFVQFDFPDQNGKPYKSSGGKMVYHPELKREIPEGWGVEKLENIANITMGQSPKGTSYNEVGEGMLFFQGSTDFGWRFPVARQYTTEPSRIAEEDDILLSVRAPVGTLNIADTRCCIGRGLVAINSKVRVNSYIFNVMQDFKKLFDMRNSVGTTFGSITKDDLYSLQLVYPPNELLMKFDQSVKSFDREIKNRSRQNQGLTQLRDWLLPMLMNGQVKVI